MSTQTSVIYILTISLAFSIAEFTSLITSIAKDETCTGPGLKCLDCWTSVNCIDFGDGNYFPQLQTCPMGRSCRDDTGYCENEGNYNCINSEPERVQCQSEGNFPDPYDCKKYFICVLKPDGEFDKYTRECSGSYVYDPFIKKCEKKVEKCASSVSICNSELESGPISGNLNIFYKCIRANVTVGYNYVPQMYDCPENFFYNGTSCVDREFTGLGDNKKCIEIGRFPSADSCYHYNTCGTIGGEPLVRACGVDYRFSPITKLCQKLDCGLCKW